MRTVAADLESSRRDTLDDDVVVVVATKIMNLFKKKNLYYIQKRIN